MSRAVRNSEGVVLSIGRAYETVTRLVPAWVLLWAPSTFLGCGGNNELQQDAVWVDIEKPPDTAATRVVAPPKESSEADPALHEGADEDERERMRRIGDVFGSLRPKFLHCFLSYLPDLKKHRVMVEFVLQRDGSVKDVKLTPGFGQPKLLQCVERVLAGAHFDAPPLGQAKVRVPLKIHTR